VIQPDSFEAEVHELHAFFERWYAGAADPSEISRLDVLADSFVMIGPDGESSDVEEVRAFVEAAYGRRPTEFRVLNVALRPDTPVGTYEEWQTADGVTTGRISTAVMAPEPGTPNGLRWLHLHETWLPDARP